MCRFLLVRSKRKIKPERFLSSFASMCEKSRAPDGDRQSDGWGIAWEKNDTWKIKKSLRPIWNDSRIFATIPETNVFAVHARAASFVKHKGDLDYNQPYVENSLCFVFNGAIQGVNLPEAEGEIGAQKIFSLLLQEIKKNSPETALRLLDKKIIAHSKKVKGMNIGLVNNNTFYVLCRYADNAPYFTLRYYSDQNLVIVCSEPFVPYRWSTMKKGEILVL